MSFDLLAVGRLFFFFSAVCLSVSTTLAQPINVQSKPARLGGSSSGGTVSNPELNHAVERAIEIAREYEHELSTPEHLLLALLDEPSAYNLLDSQGVDIQVIRGQLENYLLGLPKTAFSESPPMPHPLVQHVMIEAFSMSNGDMRSVTGATVVVAIVDNEHTYASKVLISAGATMEVLVPESAKQKQQQRVHRENNLAMLKGKIGTLATDNETIWEAEIAVPERDAIQSKELQIRVDSASGASVRFKAAVSHDGQLDLYIEETPFELRLRATKLAALFETVESGTRLKVEMIGEFAGERRVISGFGGESGALFRDPDIQGLQCSGHL